jgi:hypothetical protein
MRPSGPTREVHNAFEAHKKASGGPGYSDSWFVSHLLTLIVEDSIQLVSLLPLQTAVIDWFASLSRRSFTRLPVTHILARIIMAPWTTARILFLACVVVGASALPVEFSQTLGRVGPFRYIMELLAKH